jgi:drug/metabolite transporter (DMT)-like permease
MKTGSSSTPPRQGIAFALLASLLFGVSTPLAKTLLNQVSPALLAGIFYLGSGLGLFIYQAVLRIFKRSPGGEAPLRKSDLGYLTGAFFCGGLAAPVLLMLGLTTTPASSASLLLNLEAVFTALLAWIAFRENCDLRIVLGMIAIVAGGCVLAFSGGCGQIFTAGSIFIAAACFAWGLDNNLTRKVALCDPLQIAMLKGSVAGAVNISICLACGIKLPDPVTLSLSACLGFWSYGVSLALYVLALRHIGSARTGAYFSFAPFIGAAAGVIFLKEQPTVNFMVAAALMGAGLWLHLTEKHEHEHSHAEIEHEHSHVHNEHHIHEHDGLDPAGEPHSHMHRHQSVTHKHPHFPDAHHQHEH